MAEEDLRDLRGMPLDQLCASDRVDRLDRLESYYRSRQYEARKFDWDGNVRNRMSELPIPPGWDVPIKLRRPSTRYDLPRLIVHRYTALVFGESRFPALVVDGDDAAQDYVRALAEACGLKTKIQQARNKGGASGTAVLSFAFIEGLPRVTVHNPKHVHVLRWADWDERRPAAVLEAYPYVKTVYAEQKSKDITLYRVRYWDEQIEVLWGEVSEQSAKDGTWVTERGDEAFVQHGYGFCPVYLTQNRADADEEDGESDYEGLDDSFDSINELLSAIRKGTIANVDPTLVIMDDPVTSNIGPVRKGHGSAIYSKGGAAYLELKGDAVRTGLEVVDKLSSHALAVAGVVLGDPDKMAANAASAAMLRMLYMPMIVEADSLRDRYGRHLLVPLLTGMLRAAKQLGSAPPGPIRVLDNGSRVQEKPSILLPERIETGEDGIVTKTARSPGTLETITLNWPPYFPATWMDNKVAVDAIVTAAGNKQIISERTAVENAAEIFGIADVDAEIAALDEEKTQQAALAAATMGDVGGGNATDGTDDGNGKTGEDAGVAG